MPETINTKKPDIFYTIYIIDKNFLALFIVHNETEERTYANIESILPYKNKNGEVLLYDLLPNGNYTRLKEREGYKEPEEYAETINGQHD